MSRSEPRGVRPVGAVWIAAATSESEGSAADEDHDAEADENDGKEDVLPAFEHFRDRGAGGDELCQGHQDRDERDDEQNALFYSVMGREDSGNGKARSTTRSRCVLRD